MEFIEHSMILTLPLIHFFLFADAQCIVETSMSMYRFVLCTTAFSSQSG